MAGNFNLFFDSKLDLQDGNSTIKKKSLAKLIEPKKILWRVRNPVYFWTKHSSGLI